MSEVEQMHEPIWDSFKIVLFLAVFGSPIGGVFFSVGLYLKSFFAESSMSFGDFLFLLPTFTLFSYVIGLVPAFCTSIGIAIYASIYTKISTLSVLVITFFIVAPMAVFIFQPENLPDILSSNEVSYIFMMWFISCCLVSAYFSYRLCYNWLSISKLDLAADELEGV